MVTTAITVIALNAFIVAADVLIFAYFNLNFVIDSFGN
jgi:hypothetical protein